MTPFTISDADAGLRLDTWLKRHHPQISVGKLQQALRKGWIKLNGKRTQSTALLEAGAVVSLADVLLGLADHRPAKAPPPAVDAVRAKEIRDMVVYQDAHCLVLNKPAGLAVQGGSGLRDSVDARLGALAGRTGERPRLVHRLDRDTSGVLLLARSAQDAARFSKAFAGKEVRKIYLALAVGVPQPRTGRIDMPLRKMAQAGAEKMGKDEESGKRAVSLYHVLEEAHQTVSLLELSPVTGRTHQLRVHMAAIGHPILGDGKYGGREAFIGSLELPRRMHLHAYRLQIPALGLDVTAPLPEHMRHSMKELGFSVPTESHLLETLS